MTNKEAASRLREALKEIKEVAEGLGPVCPVYGRIVSSYSNLALVATGLESTTKNPVQEAAEKGFNG